MSLRRLLLLCQLFLVEIQVRSLDGQTVLLGLHLLALVLLQLLLFTKMTLSPLETFMLQCKLVESALVFLLQLIELVPLH